jgi:NADPH:quinone reductase-like Zn-dependent oxidoreductase
MKLATVDNPLRTPQTLLIYGGSTATGILGIQFAVLSGYRVITTSSPHNFDYLKSLGASDTFDYRSPTCAGDIKAATSGQLKLAWDCVSGTESAKICAEAMSDDGGDYVSLLFVEETVLTSINPKIKVATSLYYTVFGETMNMARPSKYEMKEVPPTPASREDFEFGKAFWETSRMLFESGKLKAAKTEVNRGGSGLEGVRYGLKESDEGKISGLKLVYTL